MDKKSQLGQGHGSRFYPAPQPFGFLYRVAMFPSGLVST
jgi:hypothetical protein